MKNNKKTMREIASDLGLSLTTVSVCLSGKAAEYKIKPATVKRVQEYVEKVGYVPNTFARNLSMPQQTDDNVALLMGRESGSEKSIAALDLTMETLKQSGREYWFRNVSSDTLVSVLRSARGEGIREAILLGSFSHKERALEQLRHHFEENPAFLHDMNIYIADDSFAERSEIGDRVYRLGVDRTQSYLRLFDRIKALDGWMACDNGCLSEHEFSEYCRMHFNAFDPARHLVPDMSILNRFDRGKTLVDPVCGLIERMPGAFIFLHDDRVATGLIRGLLERGVNIPDDVSIIGFDNIEACDYFKMPLTSISIPVERHVEMILSKILEGKELPKVVKSKAKIFWRESSKRF